MHSMFRSLSTFITTLFDTITMAAIMLNHLCRAGVERTVVVEEKSQAAAALSQLENENTVAVRLAEITDISTGISPAARQEGIDFLAAYRAKRDKVLVTTPAVIKQAAKRTPGNKPTAATT